MNSDQWGQPVSGASTSVESWDQAWNHLLHFCGDPMADLASANADDDAFVMGSVFCGVYAVMGGAPLTSPTVAEALARARSRSEAVRERAHVDALTTLVAGNFSEAAEAWAAFGCASEDLAALRFAHDIFLHVGAAARRLRWEEAALEAWTVPLPAWFGGMHAFSLEEMARYDEAEETGKRALDADPLDLWARHALAHVYEHTENNEASFALLRDHADVWREQDLLATHVWWHLALRLLAVGDLDAALGIFDEQLPTATTPFRLCDLSSLLWRTELAGGRVADRWDALADRWDVVAERHTSGFLDLHAAITYIRRPDHPGAHRWFAGLAARPPGSAEIDDIFDTVAIPLVAAFRDRARGDIDAFNAVLDRLGATTHRIGGSVAQRELIALSRTQPGASS